MRLLIEFVGSDDIYKMKQFSHIKREIHEVFIEDFPSRPLEGDLIDLSSILEEEQLNEEQNELIDFLSFWVEHCLWEKDDKGIYLKIHCIGE
jgi:hypothetical protein